MKKTKCIKGLTLIEVVIAMSLLAIMAVSVFPAFIVLNQVNTVSSERIDTTYIAQQIMERVIFEGSSSSIEEVHLVILNNLNFSFNAGASNSSASSEATRKYEKSEDSYVVQLDLLQIDDSNLWTLLVLVDSVSVGIEGKRSQLETILIFR